MARPGRLRLPLGRKRPHLERLRWRPGRRPRWPWGCGRACAAEGGGGPHPALGRRPRRRLGVSGAVRSAKGYDWSRLSRSRARKAQLRTQGGGDKRKLFNPTKVRRRAEICLLLLLPASFPPGCFRARSLPSAPQCSPQLGSGPRAKGLGLGQRGPAPSSGRCHLEEFLRGKPRGQLRPASEGLCVPRTVGAPGRGSGGSQGFLILLREVAELGSPKGVI